MAVNESAPTYVGTLKHHDLSENDMEVECSDDYLFTLAKKMFRWRSVDLGVDRSVVATMESDRTMEDEGKRRQLLERWKEKFGHEATYGKLARSFIESDMANMADHVCKVRKKALPRQAGDCSKPAAEGTDVLPSQATQRFTSQLGPESNVPPQTLVGTIGSSSSPHQQVNREVQNPEVCVDEQVQKGQSDMVTTQPYLATNGSSDSSSNKIVDVLHKVTSLLSTREAEIQRKKGKVKVLKGRKEELEGYLNEKKSKIKKLEDEAHTMEVKLAEEKWRRVKAQEYLADRENKIKRLQENIYQMDMQLKDEKDNKQEKCAELREHLEQAQASLRSETAAKEKAEAKLGETNNQLRGSQEDVDKAAYEVMILFLLAMVFVLIGVLVEVIRRCKSY